MTKDVIVLVVSGVGSAKQEVYSQLRRLGGVAFQRIKASIDNSTPVITRELFGRDEPEFATHLLRVMEFLESVGADYTVYEVLAGDTYDKNNVSKYCRITLDRLRTMIHAREESVEEQMISGRREEGLDDI